jgi:hypothetical protein
MSHPAPRSATAGSVSIRRDAVGKFEREPDFHSLSVKDLLEARDHYHVHLSHKEHVVGTAIGLYRIRKKDPDATDPATTGPTGAAAPRTLGDTVVQRWSWPSVLVFVDEWLPLPRFRSAPEALVPPRLYLPDGRVVPTCVIYAPPRHPAPPGLTNFAFPRGALGGGYPILTDVQGTEHVASAGCLVTDGNVTYVLTNRHVTGEAGTEVFSFVSGGRKRIGVSDRRQVGKLPFSDVYPGLSGRRSFSNLDAGLVRLDDVRQWTAQVYGVGALGTPVNLTPENATLDLIGCPVKAFGAASGPLAGSIMGLFFRYRSVGGFDYIADFLIGPADSEPRRTTRPGDSGTVWCWVPPRSAPDEAPPKPRPLALQWGGQVLLDTDGREMQFALASALSQVCRALDVEIVRDFGLGLSEYWGKVGHYKVGAAACEAVTNKKLRKLMLANQDRVGVGDDDIVDGNLPMNNQAGFIALADVADLVWRSTRQKDKANHFADMDQAAPSGPYKGRTLMDLWFHDEASRTPTAWTAFYDALGGGGKPLPDRHRGALPFRVAQAYGLMVEYAAAKDAARFVAVAGLAAHYVGDACQPLHVSHLHHGRPGHDDEQDVHSVYETKMLDAHRAEVVAGVNSELKKSGLPARISGTPAAAHATVELMKRTLKRLPPMDVIDAYNAEEGRGRIDHMWATLGPRTVRTIADGARTLAQLWQSAWLEGEGNAIGVAKLVAIDKNKLRALYMNKAFYPSAWLRDM